MKILALVLSALVLAACTSQKLAKQNLTNVRAAAATISQLDPTYTPKAVDAVETAEELVEASGTLPQITALGVSTDLTQRNLENVEMLLTDKEALGAPDPAFDSEARSVAQELHGQASSQAAGRQAGQAAFPWWPPLVGLLTGVGGILAWQRRKVPTKTT